MAGPTSHQVKGLGMQAPMAGVGEMEKRQYRALTELCTRICYIIELGSQGILHSLPLLSVDVFKGLQSFRKV